MSGSDEQKKTTLTMSSPKKLSLTKTVESGKVTQNFTHGRSKSVTVEVRKTRTFSRKGEGVSEMQEDAGKAAEQESKAPSKLAFNLDQMQVRDKNQLENATRQIGSKAEVKEEEKSDTVVGPNERKAQEQTENKAAAKAGPADSASAAVIPPVEVKRVHADRPEPEKAKAPEKKKIRLKHSDERRGSNKMTVAQALEYQEERMRSLASIKRQREKAKRDVSADMKDKVAREVRLPETITVQDLANRMAERVADVIKELMKMGTIATPTQSIDADTAELIAAELGHTVRRVTDADVENILIREEEDPDALKPRAPVVTIMGHVDHGKTSLLDALREANVVSGEAGGITQHIGAYQVQMNEQKVTFLDTPGHEAFTAMRSRGAQVTDVVILVVAADDGVMAQTEEAISHAKAAGVPIIVAINKMDKPEADPSKVKNELMQYEIITEEFGGDIQAVEISALKKTGLDNLIESIVLQSEMLELQANADTHASGICIEAQVDKGRGVVSTLLVQRGTLKVGDIVVAGAAWGKVRALQDDHGKQIDEAIPSQPVEVLGLNDAPMAGDEFDVVESEKVARDIAEYRAKEIKKKHNIVTAKSLDQLFAEHGEGQAKELAMVIKGDVQGSVEAIISSGSKFNSEEVEVKVLHSGVGAITESDISLAAATGAIVVGFNVRATSQARQMADDEKVDIRYYSVIYNLVDDIKDALSGLLSPEKRENLLGYAEMREIFNITKVGKVAGCMVTEGMIKRGAKVRLLRDNVVIHEGTLKTLKRFKEEVKEVKNGFECGMAFENYDDIREGDMIEAFEIEEIARTVGD